MELSVSPLVLTLLRLAHIVAGVFWFGLGASLALFIAPALLTAGESGQRFMGRVLNTTPVGSVVGIAAIVTTVAGLILYIPGIGSSYSSLGNAILGTGALAGLLAFGHGVSATRTSTAAYGAALEQHARDGQPIPAEGTTLLDTLARKMVLHTRISFYLTLIALIGMASARYL